MAWRNVLRRPRWLPGHPASMEEPSPQAWLWVLVVPLDEKPDLPDLPDSPAASELVSRTAAWRRLVAALWPGRDTG